MTNLGTIENKISSIEKYLKILSSFKKYSKSRIQDDVYLKGALERYLYLATQATIDLSEAVISYKKLRKPTTMAEGFEILFEEKIIPRTLKTRLVQMVGFRNIIAHDYDIVDFSIITDTLQTGVKDIKTFIKLTLQNLS